MQNEIQKQYQGRLSFFRIASRVAKRTSYYSYEEAEKELLYIHKRYPRYDSYRFILCEIFNGTQFVPQMAIFYPEYQPAVLYTGGNVKNFIHKSLQAERTKSKRKKENKNVSYFNFNRNAGND